jgi:hypothetical protein
MEGFIKYMRSEEAVNLHSNRNANHLLSIIAFRASRNGNPVLGVKPGEAFIGDFKKIGFTHREYRSAITNLVKWGYVTTTTTNKGTIAKLCNSDVYDINSDLFDKQTTNQRQTKDKQETNQRQTKDKQETTINNERIKERKKERKKANENFNIFSFENLTDKHNQIKRDFQIDSFPKLRRNKELNKSFLTWLIYRDANSLFEVEAHLKTFIKLVKDRFTTESIILAVDHAILNKHLSIHPTEKLKTSGYQFPSKGPIPPGT